MVLEVGGVAALRPKKREGIEQREASPVDVWMFDQGTDDGFESWQEDEPEPRVRKSLKGRHESPELHLLDITSCSVMTPLDYTLRSSEMASIQAWDRESLLWYGRARESLWSRDLALSPHSSLLTSMKTSRKMKGSAVLFSSFDC
ncbi:hypothetical protein SRHO_G00244330 [Serrasalmus rhombeus]